MTLTLIGDAHGKVKNYMKIVMNLQNPSIQLGDFGLGFTEYPYIPSEHRFLRGNHDDPLKCLAHSNYLGEFGMLDDRFWPEDDHKTFYMSGAFSIDHMYRIPGVSWWAGEELSWDQLVAAGDIYEAQKPRIVLSHECPSEAGRELLRGMLGEYFVAKGGSTESRTAEAMQVMFEGHQPDLWVFGHYHYTKQFKIGKTTFQCLNELQTATLDTETAEIVLG